MKQFTTELEAALKAFIDSTDVKNVIDETKKAADSDTGTFEVIITTEHIDRYQEVISLDGWDLTHYRNNPVVLWGHDHYTLPIGVALTVDIEDGKMIARGKFAPHEHAQEIRRLYDLGIIRATSVGFIAKERQGNVITKAELLEFSFVSVPANPHALSLAMEKELNINELVTRGFFSITKDAEPDPEPAEEAEKPEEAPETEEKKFSTKTLSPIATQLRTLADALEALQEEEPERIDEGQEAESEPEEQKGLVDFSTKKALQSLATELGDFLAEVRQREGQ